MVGWRWVWFWGRYRIDEFFDAADWSWNPCAVIDCEAIALLSRFRHSQVSCFEMPCVVLALRIRSQPMLYSLSRCSLLVMCWPPSQWLCTNRAVTIAVAKHSRHLIPLHIFRSAAFWLRICQTPSDMSLRVDITMSKQLAKKKTRNRQQHEFSNYQTEESKRTEERKRKPRTNKSTSSAIIEKKKMKKGTKANQIRHNPASAIIPTWEFSLSLFLFFCFLVFFVLFFVFGFLFLFSPFLLSIATFSASVAWLGRRY